MLYVAIAIGICMIPSATVGLVLIREMVRGVEKIQNNRGSEQ